VCAGGRSFREKMLFTHRGLSGPAVLQHRRIGSRARRWKIDLVPDFDLASAMAERRAAGDRSQARTLLAERLPKRLADRWFEVHGESKPLAVTGDREIAQIARGLRGWRVIQPARRATRRPR